MLSEWNKIEKFNSEYVEGYTELYLYIRSQGYRRSMMMTEWDYAWFIDVFRHIKDDTKTVIIMRLKGQIEAEQGHHSITYEFKGTTDKYHGHNGKDLLEQIKERI